MTGRKLFCCIVGISIPVILILSATIGYRETWRLWNLPTMTPHFADLRTITGGRESVSLGHDPLIQNPGDPWGRTMNYPRIWQALFVFPLAQSHTTYFGIGLIFLFLLGAIVLARDIDSVTAWALAAVMVSPASLLAIERGNNDMLVFFVLAMALLSFERSPLGMAGLVNVAGILKLFPIFALPCILGYPQRTALKLGICSAAVVLVYGIVTYEDLVLIRAGTPRSTYSFTYGIDVFLMTLKEYQVPGALVTLAKMLSYGFVLLIASVSLWWGRTGVPAPEGNKRHLAAFRMGAGVYGGTFMLGNNFDYRLIFLLFVVPQLLFWAKAPNPVTRGVSRLTFLAVLVAVWFLFWFGLLNPIVYEDFKVGNYVAFVAGTGAKWCVFGGLLFLLSASLPSWVLRRPEVTRVPVTVS